MQLTAPARAAGALAVVLAAAARAGSPRLPGRATVLMAAARLLSDPLAEAALPAHGVVRYLPRS